MASSAHIQALVNGRWNALTYAVPCHIPVSSTRSSNPRGGRRNTSSGGGSTAIDDAGAVAVRRLTHRIRTGRSGITMASPGT